MVAVWTNNLFKVFEQPIEKFSDLNITVLKWHDEHGTTFFIKDCQFTADLKRAKYGNQCLPMDF